MPLIPMPPMPTKWMFRVRPSTMSSASLLVVCSPCVRPGAMIVTPSGVAALALHAHHSPLTTPSPLPLATSPSSRQPIDPIGDRPRGVGVRRCPRGRAHGIQPCPVGQQAEHALEERLAASAPIAPADPRPRAAPAPARSCAGGRRWPSAAAPAARPCLQPSTRPASSPRHARRPGPPMPSPAPSRGGTVRPAPGTPPPRTPREPVPRRARPSGASPRCSARPSRTAARHPPSPR